MASFHPETQPPSRERISEEDEESCGCSSTEDVFENDVTIGERSNQNMNYLLANLVFWRNLLLAFVAGTAIVLSAAAYFSLSYWDELIAKVDQESIPTVATAAIAVSFANVCALIIFFTHQIQNLLKLTDESQPHSLPIPRYTSVDQNKETSLSKSLQKLDYARHRHQSFDTATTIPFNSSERSETLPPCRSPGMNSPLRSSAVDNLYDFLTASLRESQLCSVETTESVTGYQDKPIAELFPCTTLMFADIVGFTAWSSTREPPQVFILLETLYHAFDTLAHARNVFKVETVGDCYVAVTGLPEPRKDHAIVMARFARDCLKRMRPLCRSLVIRLGPDTCDLNIRIGIHSGPVTGGILRGERSRFQLFGDTVNTASRIETTGEGGQIHLSNATAELLKQAGKGHWVIPRPTKVVAKGKGALSTFWLNLGGSSGDEQSSASSFTDESVEAKDDSFGSANDFDSCVHLSLAKSAPKASVSSCHKSTIALSTVTSASKLERLVSWNVDLLHRLLKQIVARRQCLVDVDPHRKADADESIYMHREGTLLDEVKESIDLPSFNYSRTAAEQAEHIELDPAVYNQLFDFVRTIAKIYPDHPFHNFEHASHVTMSVTKLLHRIVAPTAREVGSLDESLLHDHTFGITSDPLTQFACILAALIHDADHPGVPNAQLVKEGAVEASLYKGKSIAEQNSFDRFWSIFMSAKYEALRKTIYTTESGLRRFRSLVVNAVLATDICDPDLKKLRNEKWDKAFQNGETNEDGKAVSDRKATIVIEHLMQASDVAHTMQHWHVYRKWNERFFQECYKAFREGRAERDPSDYWYEGEKGFFDFYIIPLAKKLKECGVFGVSSSEYLDYALKNREEWELRGREVVEEMLTTINAQEAQQLKL